MDELSREIRAMAEEIDENVKDVVAALRRPRPVATRPRFSWQGPDRSDDSQSSSNEPGSESNESINAARPSYVRQTSLASLEHKIDSVRRDTSELLRRVPEDLVALIEQAKDSILVRIDSILHSDDPSASNRSQEQHASGDASPTSVRERLEQLTPRERSVFRTCFDSGFLTYEELGEKLGLSALAAKNVVNAILRHPYKVGLLTKRGRPKEVRVGVAEDASAAVLRGRETTAGDHVAHQGG